MDKIRFASEEYVNDHAFSGDYEDLTNKPFYFEEAWVLISDTFSSNALVVKPNEDLYSNGFTALGRYRFTINGTDVYEYEKTSTGGQYVIGDTSMQTIPFALRKVHSTSAESYFQFIGNVTVTSCKAEYYTNSAKCLDDVFLSNNIARTENLAGIKTSDGGEVFNDIAHNIAMASYAHAEGTVAIAYSQASHAEGNSTTARGSASHAEGVGSRTDGVAAHAEGMGTIASGQAQHAEGKNNIESADFLHIAGNGVDSVRSNAYTLDWDGNGWFAGDVYTGSTSGKNKDEGSKKLATEEYVLNSIPTMDAIYEAIMSRLPAAEEESF